MELSKVDKLLEAYFEGNTSISDENYLKEYFSSNEVSSLHEVYRPMFLYSVQASKEKASPVTLSSKRGVPKWMQIAAVIALVASGSFYVNQYQERKQAQMALNQTREAFELLAQNFDRAKQPMSYIKAFQTTTDKVFKEEK